MLTPDHCAESGIRDAQVYVGAPLPPVDGLTARADVLKTGDRGDEIAALQRRLIELDYLEAGQDDGIFGKDPDSPEKFSGD